MYITTEIIVGQEAVCPRGLGRVVEWGYDYGVASIKVKTYIDNKEREWAPEKVKLVPITTGKLITIKTKD